MMGMGVGQALQEAPAQVPLPVHLFLLTEQTRGAPALRTPHSVSRTLPPWESPTSNLPLHDLRPFFILGSAQGLLQRGPS